MIPLPLFPDRLQVRRRARVQDDYGWHETWADHGDPLPAKVEFAGSSETVTGRDTTVGTWRALIPGIPDLLPADEVVDQHDRTFQVAGDLEFQTNPSGSKQLTIAHLRAATDV